MCKESNMKQEVLRNTIQFILCWQTTPVRVCPEVWLISKVSFVSRDHFRVASWLGIGARVYFPFSVAGFCLT